MTEGPLGFGVKKQKCLVTWTTKNEPLESALPKLSTISKLVKLLSRNLNPNMTENWHNHVIFGRPEVAGDAISG